MYRNDNNNCIFWVLQPLKPESVQFRTFVQLSCCAQQTSEYQHFELFTPALSAAAGTDALRRGSLPWTGSGIKAGAVLYLPQDADLYGNYRRDVKTTALFGVLLRQMPEKASLSEGR